MIGTTPTHKFLLSCGVDNIKAAEVVYCQHDRVVLRKMTEDFVMSDNVLSLKLSQNDTFSFCPDETIELQLRVRLNDDTVPPPLTFRIKPKKCYSREVI